MPEGLKVSEETLAEIGRQLADSRLSIAQRYRHIYTLRNIGGPAAIKALAQGFSDPSALLKHEIAYAMGQVQDDSAIPFLTAVVEDQSEEAIVRHEACEALGAIGKPECLPVLQKYASDPNPVIHETCQIALDRIAWLQDPSKDKEGPKPQSAYSSVDPAPPCTVQPIPKLQAKLLNTSLSLFERYRAMFALRNIGGAEAVKALASGFKDSSALFRHEVAYVLGQMQDPASLEALKEVLQNTTEFGMVRHEAAEAIGAILDDTTISLLRAHVDDKEQVVKESCMVALDIADYMSSDQFEYANALQTVHDMKK